MRTFLLIAAGACAAGSAASALALVALPPIDSARMIGAGVIALCGIVFALIGLAIKG